MLVDNIDLIGSETRTTAEPAISPILRVYCGGVYRHYKGGIYTTICSAVEESTGRTVVVYKGERGLAWTRLEDSFFSFVKKPGAGLVPRFAFIKKLADT